MPMDRYFAEFPREDFPRLTHFGFTSVTGAMHAAAHYHFGYEVVHFAAGGGMLTISDGIRPFAVHEDDILITTPDFLHRFDYEPDGRASYYWIGFQTGRSVAKAPCSSIAPPSLRTRPADVSYEEETAAGIDAIAENTPIDRYAVIHRMPGALAVFESIHDELVQKRTYAREMIHCRTVELFTMIYRRLAGEHAARDDAMSAVAAHMDKHYTRPISLAELGEVCARNPSYVSRRFKEVYGVSPIAYLAKKRIAAAKRSLAAGKTTAATARQCGFSDVHYFRAVFKSTVGMTPTSYGKNHARTASPKRAHDV